MDPHTTKHSASADQPLLVRGDKSLTYASSLDLISAALDGSPQTALRHAPWPLFPYYPEVRVALLHAGNCLFLKFYVEEKIVVAAHHTTHSAVYKDSCVEFFVGLDDSGYYNFEFNALGACLAAFGPGRADRQFLPVEAVDHIRRRVIIDREPQGETMRWNLILAIPLGTLVHHQLASLTGVSCRANFYKCGDDLPEPHFLAWRHIATPEPDFHQPRYFGTLVFT